MLKSLAWLAVFLLPAMDVKAKLEIEEIGNYFQVMIPTYAMGMAVNESNWDAAKQFTYSYLSMQATTQLLKATVSEKRPNYSEGKAKDSFLSGHTAAAFSGATFIHRRYGIEQAIVPYLMAVFTGYSRIQANKHYLHDVLAGALMSSLYTWIFVDRKSNITVLIDGKGIALSYNLSF
ncbi:MAG: phosphatase PAP2 family protein [Rickettsiales bacterium]|jgi:membrane-associated phospholipid phosphatase|nr:phosphatase PAP2 family protein [Rickettsiales bacterium]